ncbi:metal-dependent hydrolase family protein [Alterisphingorhabdus coralli]|uniref:Amidohydrolase family protein n=1 Tax=Alterisphingorhabdus coralli TaxID=3071408 RepID=A0AA97F8G1_9SPHN|nr:amidohydrolase family protein [Parasphingorhabdus sp. SCSIO 66989]WOE75202.1 amidohydrolase family protein [Parasphingorhabdus sp. SCSIO 66989]
MSFALTNFRLFDGENLLDGLHRAVVVEGDRIADIYDSVEALSPEVERIDLNGSTLMPGLIDAHFHCNSPSLDVGSIDHLHPSHLAQFAREHLESMLNRGFTTVRDAGGADYGLVKSIEEGLISGPRLFIAGRAISQTGGHGDLRAAHAFEPCGCGYKGVLAMVVDGEDAMRAAVRNELRKGAHQIKLFVSGGVLSPTDPIWMDQFTDVEIKAAVEEAERWRTYVMAHSHTAEASTRCSVNGVRSIEHGTLIDAEAAKIIADHQTYVVPTISVMQSLGEEVKTLPQAAMDKLDRLLDEAGEAIAHCHKAGVKLGLGTDLFGELHGRELNEFTARAQIDGALNALRSATSVNAEVMDMKGQIGVIQKGAFADMIAIDGNPIENIGLFDDPDNTIRMIMRGGKTIRNTLDCGVA